MAPKNIFIAGGSAGLGRELAKLLASQGNNVMVFGRNEQKLAEVEREMHDQMVNESQNLRAVALDLAVASEVDKVFKAQETIPDDLYCVAGGTFSNMSLFSDMDAVALDMCMRNNYFAAAFPALYILKTWVQDDKLSEERAPSSPRIRRIVFIGSVAGLCGLPGYSAYAPAKCAIRGLADTLRLEGLALSNRSSSYTVHCGFPSNFISPGFEAEVKGKLRLTADLEGYNKPYEELKKHLPDCGAIAKLMVEGVEKGDFAICDASTESNAMWANMIGASPKRGLGIYDSIMSVLMGLFIWPVQRRIWERKCKKSAGSKRAVAT